MPATRSRARRLLAVAAALASAFALVFVVPASASASESDWTDWFRTPALGSFTIEVPDTTIDVTPDRCYLSDGAEGWATTTGSRANFTITQTGPAGTRVTCNVRAYWTYRTCVIFVCYTETTSSLFTETSETYHVDTTGPENVSAHTLGTFPNAAGWYRSLGSVFWTGNDPHTGIASCATIPLPVFDTANGQLYDGCRNNLGLPTFTLFRYKYDATPPTLSPGVTPAVVGIGGSATADAGAADKTSGVASSSCNNGQPLDTSTIGTHTVTCFATDRAGNEASAATTYDVTYGFSGFAAPVDSSAINVVKAGRTVPLKFAVTGLGGEPVTDLASVKVTTTSLACDAGDTSSLLNESASGSSGLQNLGDGAYQFNWSTPKGYATSCKTLHLDLGEGITRDVEFRFNG